MPNIPAIVLFCLIPCSTLPALGGEKVRLEFDEGTVLNGTLHLEELPVNMLGTTLPLQLERIHSITWREGEPTVHLANGDRMSAKLGVKSFDVETVLGRLDIAPTHLKKLTFSERFVSVDNAADLLRAMRSDQTIYVRSGNYDLSEVDGAAKENPHLREGERGSLLFEKIKNLKLIGKGKTPPVITVRPVMADTFQFTDGRNIHLENLVLGHRPEGLCMGGVLRFSRCENVTIHRCDLFGCGTQGILFYNGSNLDVTKTIIRECTTGIMHLAGVKNATFTDCDFNKNKCWHGIQIDRSQNVHFENCRFDGNTMRKKQAVPLFRLRESDLISAENLTIQKNNHFEMLADPPTKLMFEGPKPEWPPSK